MREREKERWVVRGREGNGSRGRSLVRSGVCAKEAVNRMRRSEEGRARSSKSVWKTTSRHTGSVFSIFKDISQDWSSNNLWDIGSKFGRVIDAFIPAKLTAKSKKRFGFIRFGSYFEANRAIMELNEAGERMKGATFSWAKYLKGSVGIRGKSRSDEVKLRDQNKSQTQHATGFHSRNVPSSHNFVNVVGIVAEDKLAWLRNSLVCCSPSPWVTADLDLVIKSALPSCIKITDMGHFKFIITFSSMEEASSVLDTWKGTLDSWFEHVALWEEEECCETRRTWLEIFGMPSHGWSIENMRRIVNHLGEFVRVNESSEEAQSMASASVEIDSTIMEDIKGDVLFSIDNKVFKLMVKEARFVGKCGARYGAGVPSIGVPHEATNSSSNLCHKANQANNGVSHEASASAHNLGHEEGQASSQSKDHGGEQSCINGQNMESSSRTLTEGVGVNENISVNVRRPNLVPNVFSLLTRNHGCESLRDGAIIRSRSHSQVKDPVTAPFIPLLQHPRNSVSPVIITPINTLRDGAGLETGGDIISSQRTLKITFAGGLTVVGDDRPAVNLIDKIISEHEREAATDNEAHNLEC